MYTIFVVLLLLTGLGGCQGQGYRNAALHRIQQPTTDGGTRSITFLSSGYTTKEPFLEDVNTCIAALYNNSQYVVSDPWPRYAALLNIYAVYEKSPESGASYRHGPLHECALMSHCNETYVNSNLGCSFGTPNPHIIECNLNRVLSLATYAPVQDIVVVLVNSPEASGVGTNGLVYVANSPIYMPYLLVHYLNRAVAGLYEEYKTGLKAPSAENALADRRNCADSGFSATQWFEHWYPFDDSESTYSQKGCTYNSYIAPTAKDCLMADTNIPYMCDVCRERLSLSLYEQGVENSRLLAPQHARINLVAEACPRDHTIIYVGVDEDVYITLGSFAEQNDVEIFWAQNRNPAGLGSGPTLHLTAAQMAGWTFPQSIVAEVTDNSPYVREAWRPLAFKQTSMYILERKGPDSPCEDDYQPGCRGVEPPAGVVNMARCYECPGSSKDLCDVKEKTPYPLDDVEVMGHPQMELLRTNDVVIAATVSALVAFIFLLVIFVVHCCFVTRRPREILNVHFLDRIIEFILAFCCVVSVLLMVILAVLVVIYIPLQFIFGLQVMVISVVFGVIIFLISVLNLSGTLFRWYFTCLLCCVFDFIFGIGFFALGVFAIWAHLNGMSVRLSDALASLWIATIGSDNEGETSYICTLQYHLQCSGFHVSCFMLESHECPKDCKSNAYVNPCQFPFMTYVSDNYLPSGSVSVISGFLLIFIACLNLLFFMRYRQLSRTGKLRRLYRKDPQPPVVPITHIEVDIVRKSFMQICDKPDNTLEGKSAINFLRTVFGEPLSKSDQESLTAKGPLSFDALMSHHFPHMVSTATDPRMLTPDEAEHAVCMVELQRKQYAKLEEFTQASGCLSPEHLHTIFQAYAQKRFLPKKKEILDMLKEEASKQTPEAGLCRGLSPLELEGLRAAWIALHPKIVGHLTDDQLDLLYQWSHGATLPDRAALEAWRDKLDITRNGGKIGWGEFCYPYAQRALLRHARDYLSAQEKDIPPELVARKLVLEKYGEEVVESCFLPYESDIPVERLVAFILQRGAVYV